MKRLWFFSVLVSGVLLLSACQTAELGRLKSENETLKKDSRESAVAIEALRSEMKDCGDRLRKFDERLKTSEAEKLSALQELESVKKRNVLLLKDNTAMREENLRLMTTLDEINFAQSMLLPKSRGEYENRKYDTSEVAAGAAKTGSVRRGTNSEPAVIAESSGIYRKSGPDGRIEYFDSLSNPEGDRGFFLSIEEKAEGLMVLRLNILYSYPVPAGSPGFRLLGLGLTAQGRVWEIPFTRDDSSISTIDGYRKELVSLIVSGALAENLKAVFSGGGEVRIIHVFSEYSRERILTAGERRSLLNIFYAFQELGGRVQ